MSQRDEELFAYLVSIGVPERTLERALNPVATTALAAVYKKRDVILLSGKPGVGKSVAAAIWLAMNGRRDGYRLWIQAAELARGYAYDPEQYWKAAKAHALVIDDLGIEFLDKSDRYLATFNELVSKRFAFKRKTCLTTNLGPDEFKVRYGERITSRIHEDGAFIVCGGNDLRRTPHWQEGKDE